MSGLNAVFGSACRLRCRHLPRLADNATALGGCGLRESHRRLRFTAIHVCRALQIATAMSAEHDQALQLCLQSPAERDQALQLCLQSATNACSYVCRARPSPAAMSAEPCRSLQIATDVCRSLQIATALTGIVLPVERLASCFQISHSLFRLWGRT